MRTIRRLLIGAAALKIQPRKKLPVYKGKVKLPRYGEKKPTHQTLDLFDRPK